jgi:hypothetical protein
MWFQYEVAMCIYALTGPEKLGIHIIVLLIISLASYGLYKQLVALPLLIGRLAGWS